MVGIKITLDPCFLIDSDVKQYNAFMCGAGGVNN